MKIKANRKNNSVVVVIDGAKKELKIKNLAPDHSFPRLAMVDINSGEVLASLSGGGSYGLIVHCDDESKRWIYLKVAQAAQRANLYWPWNRVQC